MEFGRLPTIEDYGTYTNAVSEREFLLAIAQNIEALHLEEVKKGPCFSLLLDESTERSLESHVIVYLSLSCHLDNIGLGKPKTIFLSLSTI